VGVWESGGGVVVTGCLVRLDLAKASCVSTVKLAPVLLFSRRFLLLLSLVLVLVLL
jgi:hypothetical protein